MQLPLIIWRLCVTSWSKRSLSRCGLLDRILCKWRLARHYFEWAGLVGALFWVGEGGVGVYGALFWISRGVWGIILGRCWWMGVGETSLWVGGGRWNLFLGGYGWMEKYFVWVVVGGGEWGWLHCLIMPLISSRDHQLSKCHLAVLIFEITVFQCLDVIAKANLIAESKDNGKRMFEKFTKKKTCWTITTNFLLSFCIWFVYKVLFKKHLIFVANINPMFLSLHSLEALLLFTLQQLAKLDFKPRLVLRIF